MTIQFTKMHGLGNDFVVIDCINQSFTPTPEIIRHIADRRIGIGCDQVLLVLPPVSKAAMFAYHIYNQDGEEVAQCGNGARCFARFVTDKELTDKIEIPVETKAGLLLLRLQENNHVAVSMGVPSFEPEAIPLLATHRQPCYQIATGNQRFEVAALELGNPHAVLIVDDVEATPVKSLARLIQNSGDFPKGVNVGFMQIINRTQIKLRVYERGVGETQACGSGACAAVVAGIQADKLDQQVRTQLTGGILDIQWQGEGQQIIMTGPTSSVFEGSIVL